MRVRWVRISLLTASSASSALSARSRQVAAPVSAESATGRRRRSAVSWIASATAAFASGLVWSGLECHGVADLLDRGGRGDGHGGGATFDADYAAASAQ